MPINLKENTLITKKEFHIDEARKAHEESLISR